jgi:hypothetical protein
MTANDFRKLALALPETEERAHMNHPDFRVAGKIFATLGSPDKSRAMVKLPPERQHYLSKDHPEAFIPVNGAWGRRGSVVLKAADKEVVRQAIEAAWRNTAPKRMQKSQRMRNQNQAQGINGLSAGRDGANLALPLPLRIDAIRPAPLESI